MVEEERLGEGEVPEEEGGWRRGDGVREVEGGETREAAGGRETG